MMGATGEALLPRPSRRGTLFSAAQWRKRKTQEAYKPHFKFWFTCDQLHDPEQVKISLVLK